jgi:hypothetical protein
VRLAQAYLDSGDGHESEVERLLAAAADWSSEDPARRIQQVRLLRRRGEQAQADALLEALRADLDAVESGHLEATLTALNAPAGAGS